MGMYELLNKRKEHGEKLEMKLVTYEVLYQLWWVEECPDKMIADLYDVATKKITNLRHTWGIKMTDAIVSEFKAKFTGEIPPAKRNHRTSVSGHVGALIRKVEHLNDIELESLHLELARHFKAFAEVKQEVEFVDALKRVIYSFDLLE